MSFSVRIVWAGKQPSSREKKSLSKIQGYVRSNGGMFVEIYARLQRIGGGTHYLITPKQGFDLYRDIHERETAVLIYGKPKVQISPGAAFSARQLRSIGAFVKYKAFVASNGEYFWTEKALDWWDDFTSWRESSDRCSGHDDPRCLPFHIFESQQPLLNLSLSRDRSRFSHVHNTTAGASLLDRRGYYWVRGPHHGFSRVDIVAGTRLPQGFHWDVSADGTKKNRSKKTLWNLVKTYKLGKYLNIYPTGAVRAPGS